jgi:hypothetical protein
MSNDSTGTRSSVNPYQSPKATAAPPRPPRPPVLALTMEALRIVALLAFAVATLGGLSSWIGFQRVLASLGGNATIADAFPNLPPGLMWISVECLIVGTPSAIVLLTLVCRRISLPLWIVIVPLLLFDIWMSLTFVERRFSHDEWPWPRFMHEVNTGISWGMLPVTLVALAVLLVTCRKVPLYLWFIIVPAFALDFWFIWGLFDL